MVYLWIILIVSVVITPEAASGETKARVSRFIHDNHSGSVHCYDDHPCHNGGTCENHQVYSKCKCTQDYGGRHCETLKDQCSSHPCQHGGTCSNAVSGIIIPEYSYHCECQPGRMGRQCETEDPCSNNPCQNGGTCKHSTSSHHNHHNHPDGYYCECMSVFDGRHCETGASVQSDPCGSNPCKNGGTCDSTSDGFKCKCPPNWTGQQCDQDVDECVKYHFCQNGATCINTLGSFNCTCAAGYAGTQCGQDVDECVKYHFCQNGATCLNTLGSFNCTCAAGYTGRQCAQVLNMCDSQPCKNGAPCNGNTTHYTCQCRPGFVGKDCDKQDLCISANPCQNGASCISDPIGQVTCNCLSGYYGVHCEKGQPKTCDHICTLQSAVTQHSIQSTNATTCHNSASFASNEALPMHCCQMLTTDHWSKGPNVMTQCNSGTIVPYSVVALFKPDGTVEPDSSGILTDCLTGGAGFKIVRQDCTTLPTLVHVNGTIVGSIDNNPDHYFVVV